jgi:hypothetical protein
MGKRVMTRTVTEAARVALAAVIGFGFVAPVVSAQDAARVTVEVGECVTLPSPEDRFACYERQVEAARNAPTPAPPAPVPAPTDAANSIAEPPSQGTTAEKDDAPQEIFATITAARQTVPNKYVITLDNGQIWRQTYAERYPIRPGLKVKLHPSRWGGTFSLTAEEHGGFIQVERVR